MAVRVENINKNIIEWAIIRAGYEVHDFLLKFPKVQDWIKGTQNPTVKQLESFTNKLHVPFGYMFLDIPPQEEISFPLFRTNKTATQKVSLNVYHSIQMLQKRQDWLTEYLIDNDYDALKFVGKFNQNTDYKEIVKDIRQVTKLPIDWANKHDSWESALNHLSLHIEDIGVIVTFNGVVGNNTKRPISVEECRGFVLVNDYAPFLFINAADAKAAQMFTIIHELAHIWLGQSAAFDFKQLMPADDPIEILCNQVAAEFLVPEIFLKKIWNKDQNFKKLSRVFKVSPIVIARRALDLNFITHKEFFNFYNNYILEIKKKKEKQGSGGNFYATTKKRVSLRFASFVNSAVKENKLLYRDAYKLTNLKGETYNKFINEYLFQS